MTTDLAAETAKSLLNIHMNVLSDTRKSVHYGGPSEYGMQPTNSTAYLHDIPQHRLVAIAKVISRTGGPQVQL